MTELSQKLKWLVILWLARRLPDCKRMTRTLGESLDRKTSWREKLVMRLHLFTCEACERYLEQVAFLKEAAHAHGEADDMSEFSTAALTTDSRERMKAFLRSNISLAF
ncbi:MAG: zf-HC2 domain-containing protein [Acidobacteriota bacterium]